MICTRCHGLMTQQELRDCGGDKGSDLSWAYRCITFGDIIDPVILHNRTSVGRRAHSRCEARDLSPRDPRTTGNVLRGRMLRGMAADHRKGGAMKHLVTMCCLCEKVRDDGKAEPGMAIWQEFKIYRAKYMLRPADIRFTHTYCPGCLTYYRAFLVSREAAHRTEKGGMA